MDINFPSEYLDLFYLILVLIPGLLLAILILIIRKKKLTEADRINIITWNLVMLLLILSVAFLGGETYYRFFVDTTDSFGLNMITKRWAERYYQFNNLQARDNIDYEMKIEPGKRRITFIGDSFTAGHGIKSVDNRFANIIRKTYSELEVHVLAGNGWKQMISFHLFSASQLKATSST
ncbi:MAG: hypothetical protein IH946_01520 [Bacteroidetes bacterium]|nr:hypothetical protein [Bacteroidota bacterium]